MTVKNSDVLTAARRLISDPKNWTTGELARDKDGKVVAVDSPFACSWCAVGAAIRAERIFPVAPWDRHSLTKTLDKAAIEVNPKASPGNDPGLRPIAALNDKFGNHAEVLRAYDLAIETEKAREEVEALEQTGKTDA